MKRIGPKPPRIPRSLCSSFLHYILQIPSPSLYFAARGSRKHSEYFYNVYKWHIKCIEYKIANRTCTRSEWKEYRKAVRNADSKEE